MNAILSLDGGRWELKEATTVREQDGGTPDYGSTITKQLLACRAETDGRKPVCTRYREAERGFLIGSSRGLMNRHLQGSY